VSDEIMAKLEIRVAHLEQLLDAAIGVVARTNGLDPVRIRRILEVEIEELHSSDSEDDPGSSPEPGAVPRVEIAPSLSVLPGGRRS
jgi:hypothetical protein